MILFYECVSYCDLFIGFIYYLYSRHLLQLENYNARNKYKVSYFLATFTKMSNFLMVNMANDKDEFDKNIENVSIVLFYYILIYIPMYFEKEIHLFFFLIQFKTTVKASFARIYATLKARELKTLRQLDAIRKQSQDIKDLKKNCQQNIRICFDNEPILLENINKYSAIDFECLNLDSSAFVLEDYINPENDHMYSYKDLTNVEELAIEEAALKQITATENCVCYVNIRTEEVSKRFRDSIPVVTELHPEDSKLDSVCEDAVESLEVVISTTEEKSYASDTSDAEVKKIDPTDDWLNSIKNQTETEPSQNLDVMEHSTIACL